MRSLFGLAAFFCLSIRANYLHIFCYAVSVEDGLGLLAVLSLVFNFLSHFKYGGRVVLPAPIAISIHSILYYDILNPHR
jgi:hypothetical protein